MNVLEQSWFWTGAFSIISASIAIYLKTTLDRNTKIKLEKIKLYDEKKFTAYLELYDFLATAFAFYWPPDEPRKEFIYLMKNHFFIKVKKHYPYFSKEIRISLKIIGNQYLCIGDPDIQSKVPFEQFYKSEYLKLIKELEKTIEKTFDGWS